jgi:hypothetical protein
MARIRTIKPDFFTSEDIMALSPLARLLYIGTWLEADREGRLAWKPATLKVRYLPSDACDVMALADELVGRGLIVPYGDGLAFIPRFKDHQYINGKEPQSRLEAPTDESIDACRTRAGRVSDAPSFPSYIPSLPSLPDRPAVQSRGAFPPGSLPRDHKYHRLCGPMMVICLKEWEYNVLAKAYNNQDVHATRALLSQFLEVLEKGITPNESIGPFSWVEKQFHTYLKSVGKAPAKIAIAGPSISDQIDEWAKS